MEYAYTTSHWVYPPHFSPATFHLFPLLPADLRSLIWTFAFRHLMIAWPHPTFHHHITLVYAVSPLYILRCSEVRRMLDTCSLSRRVMVEEWMRVLGEHKEKNKTDKWVSQEEKALELVGILREGWSEERVRGLEYPNRWPLR